MLSNLSFRPRPIDVNKQLPIFRNAVVGAEDVDITGISRSVPQMPTGMEAEDEEEAHIQEAIKQSLRAQQDRVSIPTPRVDIVPEYEGEGKILKPFDQPQSYIRYKELTYDELDNFVEYDIDSEDEEFLDQFNKGSTQLLDVDKLELLIDRFEKVAGHNDGKIPSLSRLQELFSDEPAYLLEPCYLYWKRKRAANKGNPLNTRFIKPPDPDDPDPYKPFRARMDEKVRKKGRKNDYPSIVKMKQLRREMERARSLLEMIKKRERLKQSIVQQKIEIFEVQRVELPEPDPEPEVEDFQPTPSLFPSALPKKRRSSSHKNIIKRSRRQDPFGLDSFDELSDSDSDEEFVSSPEYSPSEDSPPLSPFPDIPSIARSPLNGDVSSVETTANLSEAHEAMLTLPSLPPFRGRCRIGRGGRILFDRRSVSKSNAISNGVVHSLETDVECYPRVHSLVTMYNNGSHPSLSGRTDAEKLLKALQGIKDYKSNATGVG